LIAEDELAAFRLGTKMLRIKLADLDARASRRPEVGCDDRQGKPPKGRSPRWTGSHLLDDQTATAADQVSPD
jgi:hypothetical protein